MELHNAQRHYGSVLSSPLFSGEDQELKAELEKLLNAGHGINTYLPGTKLRPLDRAVILVDPDLVDSLLARGADASLPDSKGKNVTSLSAQMVSIFPGNAKWGKIHKSLENSIKAKIKASKPDTFERSTTSQKAAQWFSNWMKPSSNQMTGRVTVWEEYDVIKSPHFDQFMNTIQQLVNERLKKTRDSSLINDDVFIAIKKLVDSKEWLNTCSGIKVNGKDYFPHRPLDWAAAFGCIPGVELLLQNGAVIKKEVSDLLPSSKERKIAFSKIQEKVKADDAKHKLVIRYFDRGGNPAPALSASSLKKQDPDGYALIARISQDPDSITETDLKRINEIEKAGYYFEPVEESSNQPLKAAKKGDNTNPISISRNILPWDNLPAMRAFGEKLGEFYQKEDVTLPSHVESAVFEATKKSHIQGSSAPGRAVKPLTG